jgi:hypothetical protein
MAGTIWTYESLAQADRKTLENVLLTGKPPDLEAVNGYLYCGWNHEWIGKLSGEKFMKGFCKKEGKNMGFNQICYQDNNKYNGEWKVRLRDARPIQLAFFRTSMVKDEPPHSLYKPYMHLAHFNYDLPMNTWLNLPFRVIRDFVVCPNEGDSTFMLCKAYLSVFPFLNIFYCYFLLGHRRPIDFMPW